MFVDSGTESKVFPISPDADLKNVQADTAIDLGASRSFFRPMDPAKCSST